jgi:hypothetical protein
MDRKLRRIHTTFGRVYLPSPRVISRKSNSAERRAISPFKGWLTRSTNDCDISPADALVGQWRALASTVRCAVLDHRLDDTLSGMVPSLPSNPADHVCPGSLGRSDPQHRSTSRQIECNTSCRSQRKQRAWPAATFATLKVIYVRTRRGSLVIASGAVQDAEFHPIRRTHWRVSFPHSDNL